MEGRQGYRADLVNNIHEVDRPQGTSSDAAIRRLRKHALEGAGHSNGPTAMVEPCSQLSRVLGDPGGF